MTLLTGISGSCPDDRANFYEWRDRRFSQGINSQSVINLVNGKLEDPQRLPTTASVQAVRDKILSLRSSLAGSLTLKDDVIANQFTPDLVTLFVIESETAMASYKIKSETDIRRGRVGKDEVAHSGWVDRGSILKFEGEKKDEGPKKDAWIKVSFTRDAGSRIVGWVAADDVEEIPTSHGQRSMSGLRA